MSKAREKQFSRQKARGEIGRATVRECSIVWLWTGKGHACCNCLYAHTYNTLVLLYTTISTFATSSVHTYVCMDTLHVCRKICFGGVFQIFFGTERVFEIFGAFWAECIKTDAHVSRAGLPKCGSVIIIMG